MSAASKILGEVKLRHEKLPPMFNAVQHDFGFPFHVNPRGRLVHRVRSMLTHYDGKVKRHSSCTYFCGNVGFIEEGSSVSVPPADRLLCERCEALAVAAGEKSASELAGRHVHTGRMVPIRSCCKDVRN